MKTSSSHSRFRSLLWPIYGAEHKKLFPMLIMLSLICFNYSLMKNMKDALVVTAHSSGAEVIPFIKVWGILPSAIGLTYLFTRLSNRFSQQQVFSMMLMGFISYFLIFTLFLYPNQDILHPHATADHLQSILPSGFKGLIAMFRNWTFTSFYIVSELWATMILGVLFWGFANHITSVTEAQRFYGILHLGSNIATAIAGQIGLYFTQPTFNPNIPFGNDEWEQTLMILVGFISIGGVVIYTLYHWTHRHIVSNVELCPPEALKSSKKSKPKYSLRESIAYLSQSKYLMGIAIMVVGYNVVINLVEVVWKGQVKVLYPNPTDYNMFMSQLTTTVGILSALASLFLPMLIHYLGWTKTALITPVLMLVTSMGFFSFLLVPEEIATSLTLFMGMSPVAVAVFFGASQNCISKASKYSVFDSTKEIAFIPLDPDSKMRCKAAIDGIGSRLGKSGSSLTQQGLILLCGSLAATTPYLACIVIGISMVWILSTRTLGRQFSELTSENENNEITVKSSVQIKPTAEQQQVV